MSKSKNNQATPRSIRQKQILDVAAENPEITMEAIADEVPSASPELVERVLNEYGDPAEIQDSGSTKQGSESEQGEDISLTKDDLSSEQVELLKLIHKHPKSSQRELGEMLGVSRTTVSNRANSIDEFEWQNRHKFADSIFESPGTREGEQHVARNSDEARSRYDALSQRVEAIEQQIESLISKESTDEIFNNHNLTHKVLHACVKSEYITEEEELQIFQSILE